MITIFVETDKEASLETRMRDKKSIVRVVRLWQRYKWLGLPLKFLLMLYR